MKKYDKDKQREQWAKYEAMGKGKYVAFMTAIFGGSVLLAVAIPIIVINHIFGGLAYNTSELFLKLSIYIIAMVLFSIVMGSKTWDKKMREFHGYEVAEVEDAELKQYILDGEKIKAVKRYRDITGAKLKDAIEYVEIMCEKYL
ncbi:hypothetical protein [Clostridium fungisolvens]|uniref:Uncharacterized protein n=1 Tax=Clostridium fungisolvens TaxID=1604897 RepID=A0A6V8SN62_9CLOT|nr:hypothetical protein [Clostridium fungisolvens]GFP76313.1 hypothetical protein bsdtw1_02415 [Clostridium fungisolvens]